MPSLFDQMPMQEGQPQPAKDPLAGEISREVGNMQANNPNNNPINMGVEPATEEENQKLAIILDAIEGQIHGPNRDKMIDMLDSSPELWLNIATASDVLLEGVYQKLVEQGEDVEPDYFFGENGIIQSTVEMVYELALAAGVPGSDNFEQLDAAYMKTLQLVGEELFETDDVAAVEAQQAMLDLEFGEGASDIAAEGFELAGGSDAVMEENMMGEDLLAGINEPPLMRPEV